MGEWSFPGGITGLHFNKYALSTKNSLYYHLMMKIIMMYVIHCIIFLWECRVAWWCGIWCKPDTRARHMWVAPEFLFPVPKPLSLIQPLMIP